jgi:pimeloyl-ACP methyl ester carboxylesterase
MGATCWKPALGTIASRRPKRSSAEATASRLPSRVVRSAANGSPGPAVVGLEVDGQNVEAAGHEALGDRAADAAGRARDDDAALVFGGHGEITTRVVVTMTPRSPSEAMGTFIPVNRSAGLPSAAMCGVTPATSRTIEAAVETWSATVSGMTDYWSAAITERRTPADVALDGLRWWQVMSDRRPPQWASRQRIVRRSPLTRLRDFTPPRADDVVPTLVLPPQAGHDSCIVDYSTAQSQMQTILAAGLERLYALDWIGVTQETKGATITDYLAEVDAAVAQVGDGGRVNLVGDCQGGWLATIYAALHPERVNTLTIAGAPIDFHAGGAIIHESVEALSDDDLSFYRALVRQGNGVLKGEFLLGGFIVIKPENEVGKQLQLLAHVRDARHVERYRAFEDWFKHTQDIAGPFYLWLVAHLFRDNELIRGNAAHRRRGGRPRAHRVPRQPPGRRHRPHHAARAGLRPRRGGVHARQAHHAAHDDGRPPRALHGQRGPARPLAGRDGIGARAFATGGRRRPGARARPLAHRAGASHPGALAAGALPVARARRGACAGHEGAIDLEQGLALAPGQARVLADGLFDRAGDGLRANGHARLLVERVGGDLQGCRDRVEHAVGRLAQAALDLRQVRIGDPGQRRELPHRQLVELALAADDLAQALGWCPIGHRGFILVAHRA